MDKSLLPSKAQNSDEVSFVIGTAQPIKAFVSAVKFYEDGDISYDLRIPVSPDDPDIQTRIEVVSSACVNVINGSAYKGWTEQKVIKLMAAMCEESLDPELFEKWKEIEEALVANRKALRQ